MLGRRGHGCILGSLADSRGGMGDYEKLEVWQRAHRLTLEAYATTKGFPDGERFGLVSQIRRAAASVPANIVEGCGRNGDREMARFLRTALGSAQELEYHLLLARDLALLDPDPWASLTEETKLVRRMLASLIRKLSVAPKRPHSSTS